ncbi:10845_t:CDS:2, partial [Cetraspora pellucida]
MQLRKDIQQVEQKLGVRFTHKPKTYQRLIETIANLAYLKKYTNPQERMKEVSEKLQMNLNPKKDLVDQLVKLLILQKQNDHINMILNYPDRTQKVYLKELQITPNRISEEPRTTIQENLESTSCKICFGKYRQHKYQYCPDTICNKCRRKGHTYKDCLSNECLTCGQNNHITAKLNEHHACGCAINEIISERNLHLTNPDSLISKNKKNHCCNCHIPLAKNNLTPLQQGNKKIKLKYVANPNYDYTYEEREEHWLNSRRLAGNYITVNRSITKRIYDYITQGLHDLELLENLKEKQENNEISDPEMPLLYNDFLDYNQKKDFNQAINDSFQTKTKLYQEYCQEMQDKTNRQNTLCKQCLLVINLSDESTYINVANQIEQTIDPYHINCYNEKEKAKEEAPKNYFFNELLTTEQEILNKVLYNYPLRFEAMEKAIQKVEIENQVLNQQIDFEHFIELYKYENIKKILERI